MIVESIIFLIVSWWIILFILLPLKIRVSRHPKTGLAASAPLKPYVWQKITAATIISVLLTALYAYLRYHHHINYHTLFS